MKQRPEVSMAVFSHLFSEITQQMMKDEHKDIEQQLHDLGVPIGQ